MKRTILPLLILSSLTALSQDSAKVATARDTARKERCFKSEIGINVTSLIKQVFSLSNTNLTTLPYDVTYKHIRANEKWAIRAGLGITMTNSSVKSSTNTTGTSTATGPDPVVPTVSNSMNLFYRAGWEYRFVLHPKIMVCTGLDLAGQYGYSHSQSSEVSNNLPSSYSYNKTKVDVATMAFGGGPVAGIQFYLLKNLSLFTEMPVYFQYSTQKEETENYQNRLAFGGSSFEAETNKEKVNTRLMKASIALPVTLYLALKF